MSLPTSLRYLLGSWSNSPYSASRFTLGFIGVLIGFASRKPIMQPFGNQNQSNEVLKQCQCGKLCCQLAQNHAYMLGILVGWQVMAFDFETDQTVDSRSTSFLQSTPMCSICNESIYIVKHPFKKPRQVRKTPPQPAYPRPPLAVLLTLTLI